MDRLSLLREPHPLRVSSLSMTIFLKIFSSCLSCSSWIKDMLCYPRETSPRSFHFPGFVPRSLTSVVASFAAPPRTFDDLGSFMV